MVELIITMMVISIAVLGITYSLSFAFKHQSDGVWQVKSVALAEAYIDEIMARRFDEATPIGGVPPCPTVLCTLPANFDEGETRENFDDVDDFNGLDELPPLDAFGVARDQYSGYRVQVAVSYASSQMVTEFGLDTATDAKLITVSITPPGRATLVFPFVRGNY